MYLQARRDKRRIYCQNTRLFFPYPNRANVIVFCGMPKGLHFIPMRCTAGTATLAPAAFHKF
jgi:hypothetical protein